LNRKRCKEKYTMKKTFPNIHSKAKYLVQMYNMEKNRKQRALVSECFFAISSNIVRKQSYSQMNPNWVRQSVIQDGIINSNEAEGICNSIRNSELQYIFSSPGERKTVILGAHEPGGEFIADVLGIKLFSQLLSLKLFLSSYAVTTLQHHNLITQRDKLLESGCILSWLSPPPQKINGGNNNENIVRWYRSDSVFVYLFSLNCISLT